ncbi:glycosyltransferase family protein [Sedimentitalea sp. HM32M-2]|uniref:glycosyltransferase family protein n=1 Tax=Sedimentitalea sp. HM32M-2 TaxID=3351566 RepID=UPI0036442666
MRAMIVVTHLLGTGHLRRALNLARAFCDAGHPALLVSGGLPLPELQIGQVRLWQLPPLRSDGVNFTRLLDETGAEAGAALLQQRQDDLIRAVTEFAPNVLITELFPFGRRVLTAEFQALLERARDLPRPPLVLSSVRDILAPPSKPAKAEATDEIIARHYDAVLVHSDAQSTRLQASWPVSPALAARLRYTGYVAPAPAGPHPQHAGEDEILVSAGGGSVGDALFACACAAARQMPEHRWRLLFGGADATQRIAALKGDGPAILEPARPDFRQMLTHVAASVSLCGYNTALDVLQAGARAVFVPFDDGREVEQTLRAEALSHLPGITTLRTADLTPDRLCAAVRQVLTAPARHGPQLCFDGAARTVALAQDMLDARA